MRSESKEEKITGESFERLVKIEGMNEEMATVLFDNGYRTAEDIAKASLAELTSFIGITEEKGRALINGALRYLANPPEEEEEAVEEEQPEAVAAAASEEEAEAAEAETAESVSPAARAAQNRPTA